MIVSFFVLAVIGLVLLIVLALVAGLVVWLVLRQRGNARPGFPVSAGPVAMPRRKDGN